MDKNNKIALALGGFVCFCGICVGAYTMGRNSSQGENATTSAVESTQEGEFSGNSSSVSPDSASGLDFTAQEMRLQDFFGSLSMSNLGEMKVPVAGSRLVSQDNLTTAVESNAYVLLDSAKVLRVDETSQVEIRQEAKHFDVDLLSGTLFFNVSESLGADESLEFYSNNVVTGVRGTSGVISYSKEEYQSRIFVLTGSVDLTTRGEFSDTYTVNAGEMAICTTQYDGTVDVVILSQEEKGNLFFTDTFIDNIQGDLNAEGDSFNLSENLRKPDFLTLSNNIQVLGDCRNMSYEQAEGFATVLRNWNGNIDKVTFFDGGGGVPVMILGIEEYYEVYEMLYWEYVNHFYQWNGTYAEAVDFSRFTHNGFDSGEYTLGEKNGVYSVSYGPYLRGYSGTSLLPSYSFRFEQGQCVTTPFMIGIYGSGGYSHYGFDTSDYAVDVFNWNLVGSLTNSTDMMAHLRQNSTSTHNVNSYFYQGAWKQMEWDEVVSAGGNSVDIPWNDTALVLAELGNL